MQRDVNVPAEAGHRLVDRVVDDLVYQVVQAPRRRIANIHARALSDCFDAFKNADIRPGIGSRPAGAISMTVVWGKGCFHRLGLGSLDHCALALAQIHCVFTSVLFARFTSTASSFAFSPTPVLIRSDGARRLLPAAHHGPDPASDDCHGGQAGCYQHSSPLDCRSMLYSVMPYCIVFGRASSFTSAPAIQSSPGVRSRSSLRPRERRPLPAAPGLDLDRLGGKIAELGGGKDSAFVGSGSSIGPTRNRISWIAVPGAPARRACNSAGLRNAASSSRSVG